MDDKQHRIAVEAFQEAVRRASSQSAFARLTGATQQSVSNWLRHSKPLPGDFVVAAERETGVSKHLLRPDIFGTVPLSAGEVDYDQGTVPHSGASA